MAQDPIYKGLYRDIQAWESNTGPRTRRDGVCGPLLTRA